MVELIAITAPAKLNLTLEVIERLPSGYHNIRSVLVRLDKMSDTIELRIDPAGNGIHLSADSNAIPVDGTNLCHQAATHYLTAIGATAKVDMHIAKMIPVAAGLGGGSSDAAAVLLGLNQFFSSRLSADCLSLVGSQLGKDIPFFLTRAPAALVTGMGETVEPLPGCPDMGFLVVNPGVSMSTKAAYEALAQSVWFMSDRARVDVSGVMSRAVADGDRRLITSSLFNDFEIDVEREYPIVKEIKQALIAFGAEGALMSGSGSTVFGIFGSGDRQLAAQKALRQHYPSFVVRAA